MRSGCGLILVLFPFLLRGGGEEICTCSMWLVFSMVWFVCLFVRARVCVCIFLVGRRDFANLKQVFVWAEFGAFS